MNNGPHRTGETLTEVEETGAQLHKRAGKGVIWAALGRVARVVSQVIFIIFLGRMISPALFGSVTIAFAGYQLVVTLASQSYAQALIQLRLWDDVALSTAYWLNLALALVVCAATLLVAPYLATLLDLPEVAWLLPFLSLAGALTAFNVISQAKLADSLKFGKIAKVETLGSFGGLAAGVIALYTTSGITALIIFSLGQRLIELVLFQIYANEWPKLKWDGGIARRLTRYTGPIAAMQILTFFTAYVDQFFVGLTLSPAALGQFGLARRLTQQPTQMLSFAITRALFPAFIKAKSDIPGKDSSKELFLMACRNAVMLPAVCFAIAAIIARPGIITLLGEKWSESAPILAIFCVSSIFLPVGGVFAAVLRSGRANDVQFYLAVLRSVVLVLVLTAAFYAKADMIMIAIFVSVANVLLMLPTMLAVQRYAHMPLGELSIQMGIGLVPGVVAAVAALAMGVFCENFWTLPLVFVILQSLAGLVAGALAAYLLSPAVRARLRAAKA